MHGHAGRRPPSPPPLTPLLVRSPLRGEGSLLSPTSSRTQLPLPPRAGEGGRGDEGALHVQTRSFTTHKAGNRPDEYEDAVCPAQPIDSWVGVFRCAVADGATETSFSDLWASMLVHAWCEGALHLRDLVAALAPLQAAWRREVGGRPLPWYAAEKVQSGAFAALLGLTVLPARAGRPGRWRAAAVGDSCLVQVRGPDLLTAFPLQSADAFDNRPILLSSNPDRNRPALAALRRASGIWRRGDELYLMTDALASWFLGDPGTSLAGLRALYHEGDDESFPAWVDGLRATGHLRNDDVTVLRLTLL